MLGHKKEVSWPPLDSKGVAIRTPLHSPCKRMSQQVTYCPAPPDLVGTAESLQHGQPAYEEGRDALTHIMLRQHADEEWQT